MSDGSAPEIACPTPENSGRSTLWKPGQSGNPAGKPKGARNKLGEAFIEALHDDFKKHGVVAIEKVRCERPHEYLKVVASLLPKQVEVKADAFDGINEEQLAALIVAARSALGGAEGSGERAENPAQPHAVN